MRTQKIYRSLVTLSLVGLLTACGGGGGGGGGDDAPAAVTSAGTVSAGVSKGDTVTGGVTKGPVQGATVLFYPVDQFGLPLATEIASARTNAAGNFTVTLPAGAGMVLVESFGGSFIDEADRAGNRVIQLGPNEGFSSILPNGSARVAINPITDSLVLRSRELAASEGGFGGIFNTSRATFASEAGFDAFTTVPANPTSPAAGASLAEKQYALLLGGLANVINVITVELGLAEPTYEVIKAVIFDLVDGELNGLKYGEPVRVQGANGVQNLATDIDFIKQLNRFKNNNAAAYSGTAAPAFDFSIFANRAPTANAAVDQTVASGELVTLDGSASSDPEGGLLFSWEQTLGPAVTLIDATTATPTFTAPNTLIGNDAVAFTLTVTDAANATAKDAVIVNVTGALPQKFLIVDQIDQGDGIGEDIDDGAVVTLNPDGSGSLLDDEGTVAIQYTVTGNNTFRINYPTGYVQKSFSETITDPNSGSDIVIQLEVRPAFIDLTVVQDLVNADVIVGYLEGQILASDARFNRVLSEEDILLTAYDFAQQIPFVVEDQSERMLKVNLAPQISLQSQFFKAEELHEDILVFNANGTGKADDSALEFLWAIQADGHLRVTYLESDGTPGDIADYYHMASGPSGDIVSTDMSLVTPLVAGDDNLINELGLSFKRTASRPILTTANAAGIYSGLITYDKGQEFLLSYRLNPDGTGGIENRSTLSDGTVKWFRQDLSLCWNIDEDNVLVTRRGFDEVSLNGFHYESSPTFCSSLDGSENVVTSSSDLELFSIVGDQYRFHDRYREAANYCFGSSSAPGCETGPLLLFDSMPEVVTKEILTAVPPLPVDDFFEFDANGTSFVTVDVLSNDLARDFPIDTATVQIVVPPSTGAATVDPLNGAITFTYAGDANLQETIQYRVADTEGNRSSVGSLSITINLVPTANAGVDQTAVSGATVTLDGSASNDLEGGPVTYSWVQIDAGPQVSLSNATAVNPTFAAALGDAVLEFALKVTADDGATATDTVTVTLTNVLPKANAGVDQTVASGVTATLDGSASNDLEGVVSYSWVQSSGPAVTLSNATVANPTFSAAFGYAVLEFSLTVTDVNGGTATDAVIVTLSQVISSLNIDDGNLFNCILDTGAHFAAHITSLSCPSRSIINLLGIEALGSLSTLDLSKNSIVDLAFLSSLTGLVYLDVSGNQVSDLSPLSGLVSLDHLLANNNEIVDLTPLGGLTALVHLNLDYNRVVDLSPLSGLSSLRLLTAGYNRIIDLTPVSSLTGLEHLAMASNRVMTLPPLSSAGLQWVDLHRNSIQGLSALSGLAGLEYLNVAHNRADDLSPLSGVVSLKTLRVGHNLIVDLTPLAGLTELVTLKAPHNLIADASPLSSLTQLSFLALNRNLLSTLPNLPISLTTLQAAHNQLVDIDALAGFTQLLELNLRDNHLINDEAAVGSALLTLTGLLTLDISNNAIDNFDALNSSALVPSSLITDEARPALTSLTLMPNDVIDLDKSLPELNVTITNSAATAGQFTLTSPTRSQVIFLPLNSNFDATYKFNEFADQGDWRVSDILFLTSPQRHQYNDFAIGHLYGPDPKAAFNADRVVSVSTSGSQTPDLEPPVLESLTITPSSVDLANGPALVDFTATFSDAPAGVAFSNLTIFDVDSNPLRSFSSSDGALSFRYMVGFTDESFRIGNISAHDFTWNQLALGFQQLIQAGFDVDVDVIGTLDPALRNSVTGPIFSEFKGRSSPHNPSYQFKVLTPGVVGVGFKWTDMGNDALLILRDEIGEELSSDGDFLFTLSPQLGLVLPVGIYSVELSANVNSESKTFFELTFLGDVTDIKRDSDGDGITDDVSEDDDGDGFLDADEITAGTDPLDPTDTPESSAKGDAAG